MEDTRGYTVTCSKTVVNSANNSIPSEDYIEPTEDPYIKSISYLEKHNILQLFQTLTSDVVYNRPSDPLDYLIKEVQQLKKHKKQLPEEQTEDTKE